MDINEYFRTTTPPICYHKIPDGEIEVRDRMIHLISWPEFSETEGLSLREHIDEWNIFYKNNYLATLCDNSILVNVLTLITALYDKNEYDQLPNDLLKIGLHQEVANTPYNRIEYVERMKRELYGTFLCYLHLVWHDPYAYDKLLNREIIPYNSKKDAEYRIAIDGSPTDTCWNYLRHTARNFNVDYASIFTAIKFVKAKNDGVKIVEYRTAYTLAEALLYQLFMHISAGEEALNGCTYAECELCHKMFIKDHGNKRFCKECSKNHVRVAAYRKKKKEGAPHAQESNP